MRRLPTLGSEQLKLLSCLLRCPGLTASQIKTKCRAAPGSVHTLLKRLEDAGLVQRSGGNWYPKPKGRRVYMAILALVEAWR